ncbi:MAG TPA: aconitase X [Desulfatiglandales bacterium]|nr:aconitase X [Desulfatiglandales bacterium]
MKDPAMKLTQEERDILEGNQGLILQKVMRTLILYGEALSAEKFVDIEGPGHFSIPFALPGVGPRLEMLDELAEAGLKTKYPFTLDPKAPLDFENLFLRREQEQAFDEMFRNQGPYDRRMLQLGLRDEDAYTCTPYLPEVGNIAPKGTILAWSESSCVVYANSVLGARTNRNAAIMDILSNIAGKTPLAGLLTDQGRRATWRVEVDTSQMPNPQLLGAAIGMKVLEDVPYVVGLDRFLDTEINETTRDYLKEMGAACAAIGAVGLYHVEHITPEAIDHGANLLRHGHRNYHIDDEELRSLMDSYPVMWTEKGAKPEKCLIGCPHLSLRELKWWACQIPAALEAHHKDRLAVDTVLCAAPQVLQEFKAEEQGYERLRSAGVKLSGTCPEAYMDNQLCARDAVITNSNKLRAFTTARMFLDEDLLEVIVTGEI